MVYEVISKTIYFVDKEQSNGMTSSSGLPKGMYRLFNCENLGEILLREKTGDIFKPGDKEFELFKEHISK